MQITLQGSVAFEPGFIAKLPQLEQAMAAHGFEASALVIAKDFATPATMPKRGTLFYDYTVVVDGENFTVTEPGDMRFLDGLVACVLTQDPAEPAPLRKAKGLLARFARWTAQPV